eukprot:1196399-Prorocentrum_minimum.AAC.5
MQPSIFEIKVRPSSTPAERGREKEAHRAHQTLEGGKMGLRGKLLLRNRREPHAMLLMAKHPLSATYLISWVYLAHPSVL